MRKILILLIVFITIGCSNKLYKWYNIGNKGMIYNEYEKVINRYQLDSICKVDSLNNNIDEWLKIALFTSDYKEQITQYTYIKKNDSEREIIYVLTPQDSLFIITKRITIK